MRRRFLLPGLLVAVALMVVGLGAAFLRAGYFLEGPAQAPVKADLIAALGGDNGARAVRVLEIYRAGLAPRILLSGPEGMHSKVRPSQVRWREQFLREEGIPASALLYDGGARNSWEEAVHTLRLMRERKLEHVLVVSDPPHLRRLSWVWGKVFAGSGKRFTLVASDMEDWDAAGWWKTSPNAQFVFGEVIKLAYYVVQY